MTAETTTTDQALLDAIHAGIANGEFEVFQPITWEERRIGTEQVAVWIARLNGIRGIISESKRLNGWVVTVGRDGDDEEFEMSIQDTWTAAAEVGNRLIRDLA